MKVDLYKDWPCLGRRVYDGKIHIGRLVDAEPISDLERTEAALREIALLAAGEQAGGMVFQPKDVATVVRLTLQYLRGSNEMVATAPNPDWSDKQKRLFEALKFGSFAGACGSPHRAEGEDDGQ